MPTTIKVSNELRDRLKQQASSHGRTIGEHLAALADEADREARFARLRSQIAATAAAERADFIRELEAWDGASGDGLPADDFRSWPGYVAP